jgi:hypothetical protein
VSDAVSEAEIEAELLNQCAARRHGATLCPSDVARALAVDEAEWRAMMPMVREVAARLAEAGQIVVTQRGAIVDARTARGPIRLARRGP